MSESSKTRKNATTDDYRRGYQAGYEAAKKKSIPKDGLLQGRVMHALLDKEREKAKQFCLNIILEYQVPVGNSSAGELAQEWTIDALREIARRIRADISVEHNE